MKIRKNEVIDPAVRRTEQAKKNLDPSIKSKQAQHSGEEIGRVDVALGRELQNIAESTNPRVAELKKIFEAKGVSGLNALYNSEDDAKAFLQEVGSFVDDFRDR